MSPSRIDRAVKTQREFQGRSCISAAAAQRAVYEADSSAGCCQRDRLRICSPPNQSQAWDLSLSPTFFFPGNGNVSKTPRTAAAEKALAGESQQDGLGLGHC